MRSHLKTSYFAEAIVILPNHLPVVWILPSRNQDPTPCPLDSVCERYLLIGLINGFWVNQDDIAGNSVYQGLFNVSEQIRRTHSQIFFHQLSAPRRQIIQDSSRLYGLVCHGKAKASPAVLKMRVGLSVSATRSWNQATLCGIC